MIDLAHDVDAFALEALQWVSVVIRAGPVLSDRRHRARRLSVR